MAIELTQFSFCLQILSEVEPVIAVSIALFARERGASELVALRIDGVKASVAGSRPTSVGTWFSIAQG